MRILTVRQPWAWLIVHGYKPIENRGTWGTDYRGPVVIHAAKGMTGDEHFACQLFIEGFDEQLAHAIPTRGNLDRGGVVGIAKLVDMLRPGSAHPSPWYTGDYGFVFDDARPLPFIPWTGALGLRQVSGELRRRIEEAS